MKYIRCTVLPSWSVKKKRREIMEVKIKEVGDGSLSETGEVEEKK